MTRRLLLWKIPLGSFMTGRLVVVLVRVVVDEFLRAGSREEGRRAEGGRRREGLGATARRGVGRCWRSGWCQRSSKAGVGATWSNGRGDRGLPPVPRMEIVPTSPPRSGTETSKPDTSRGSTDEPAHRTSALLEGARSRMQVCSASSSAEPHRPARISGAVLQMTLL